ncbi:hypothetical protein L3X38_028019 [Prunus dulcis]|uniref:Uncharacterized protein n=1 Tax=Prunus dulcis TaxID=3755 RepID=A0AAD4VRM8_PRUDU|nr:hypothetical protein L3X38_028019 [Prunus dulcis]
MWSLWWDASNIEKDDHRIDHRNISHHFSHGGCSVLVPVSNTSIATRSSWPATVDTFDSGATDHMTFDPSQLISRKSSTSSMVSNANGHPHRKDDWLWYSAGQTLLLGLGTE